MFSRLLFVIVVAAFMWAVFVRPSEGAGPERVYVVQPADTLWTIASSNYGGDPRKAVWRVKQRNGLESATLRPGQRIFLP